MNGNREAFEQRRMDDVCRSFSENPPRSADEWLMFGRAQLHQGRAESALVAFAAGLATDPAHLGLKFYQASALARLHRWLNAEDSLADCVLAPEWAARGLSARAQVRVAAGSYTQAVADYERLEITHGALAPHDWLGYAACLVELAQWHEAAEAISRVIHAGRAPEVAWLILGRCCEGQGKWVEAAETYRRALQQHPDSKSLSSRLIMTGRRPSARKPDLLLLTSTSRHRILGEWRIRQKQNPADFRLTHRIALLATMTARHCRVSKGTVFRDLWRTSIAHWVCLMANDRWFEAFLAERSEAYQRHLDEASVRQFRHELAMRFSDLVESAGRTVKQIGMPTLGEEFARELQAARACREMPGGGLRLPQSAVPLACGPAMLCELGVIDALEENLAQWPAGDACVEGGTGWADPGVRDSRVYRLRRLFSSLGFAQARLEQGNPAGALESLRWVLCAECAGKVTDRDPAHLAVCRSGCPQFVNRNPGFRDCRDPSGELQRQGQWLRVQALVGAAEQVILLAEPDAEEARQHWHTLLRLVPDEAGNSRLQEHLLKRVELRVAGMHEDHLHRKAVQLIDAANECFRQPRRFEGILGQILTDWGVQTAKDGQTFDAIEPLERALQLNPDIHRARTSFVRVLHCAAGKSADNEKFEQARAYLDQADAVTSAAGVGFAETDELREESTLARIEFCCRSWNHDYRRRDLDAAARNLEDGIRLANAPLSNPRHRQQAEAMAQRLNEYLGLVCDAAARECVRGGDDAAARRWQARARN